VSGQNAFEENARRAKVATFVAYVDREVSRRGYDPHACASVILAWLESLDQTPTLWGIYGTAAGLKHGTSPTTREAIKAVYAERARPEPEEPEDWRNDADEVEAARGDYLFDRQRDDRMTGDL